MNNSFIYGLLLVSSFATITAQNINYGVQPQNNSIVVNTDSGQSNSDAFRLSFQITSGNSAMKDWKVSVKTNAPILSNNGNYTLPADKISFQPSSTTDNPSIAEIGMPMHVDLLGQQDVYLVPNSNADVYTQGGNTFYLYYNITIAGGTYLNDYPEGTKFTLPLNFTAYHKTNKLLGSVDLNNIMVQIQIPSAPTPQFSIKVDANATNGLLELKTMNDYTQGAQKTYSNGLSIKANTDYQVHVRSIQENFTSTTGTGNTFPLESINILLTPGPNNTASTFKRALNANPQKIASGGSTQESTVSFDITYSSDPNDMNLINASMETYSTTLQYEITPQ
ncbi:hypothetical protein HCG49_16845 [Arenibacter sp. 6A1]|uniref:hypothetical protein n=1 Tax=Arenibacter sp. 6A1 TaxID=2720391 RepID=UPI0014473F29|nr:hypothetical protein [Arenibacter sp. 6A1]NKI28223.1 hypothetical protein [Arenibacter sp. 6A1]